MLSGVECRKGREFTNQVEFHNQGSRAEPRCNMKCGLTWRRLYLVWMWAATSSSHIITVGVQSRVNTSKFNANETYGRFRRSGGFWPHWLLQTWVVRFPDRMVELLCGNICSNLWERVSHMLVLAGKGITQTWNVMRIIFYLMGFQLEILGSAGCESQ